MAFCSKCGTELTEGAKFCPKCGESVRVASDGKQGNNNEFMLDYLELVPKSVYGIDGDGEMEDDL